MLSPEEQEIVEHNRTLVETCLQQYNLPANPNIDEKLLLYEMFPKKVSKLFAVLILAYKQEVTSTELSKISPQSAGLIRDLRDHGFVFEKEGAYYEYTNTKGDKVRKITGFDKNSAKNKRLPAPTLQGGVFDVYLDSFEIHNFFCIKDIRLQDLSNYKEIYFLGENGDGKTLLLQGLVYAINKQFIENANMNVPYIGIIKQMVIDSNLTTNSTFDRQITDDNFIKNLFAYGVHRCRKNINELDKYGFGTLFSDDVYLRSPEEWLIDLDRLNFRHAVSIKFDDAVLMLQELLAENVEIKLDEKGTKLEFIERGFPIAFTQLSEGYKSVITWAVDMLSRLAENQPEAEKMQDFQGIVLVDEISLHLHPKWEFQIVRKLRAWFPKIQFIFTTHSPVNIMGASEDAIFFRLYKDEQGYTQVSEPFYASEMSHLMANSIITSPLFGMESARMRVYDANKDLDTSDDYLYARIHKAISEDVVELRKAGKKFISTEKLDEMIKNALEKHKKA